jgi:hypothetical protein
MYDSVSGGSPVSAGGIVKRWEDRSGNSRHATLQVNSVNSAYTGPTFRSNIKNGLPVLQFGDSGNGLYGIGLDAPAGLGMTSTGATIFAVAKPSNWGTLLAKATSANAGWWYQVKDQYGNVFVWSQDGSIFSQVSSPSATITDFSVIALSVPSGALPNTTMYINGAQASLSLYQTSQQIQVPPSTSAPVTIGYSPQGPGSTAWAGYCGEIALYEQQLSSTAISQITSFLKTKWGIS